MKNKNAARIMPKFGLTVEKRPGAAIKGGNTRIHLLADSELTQVKQNTTSTAREFRGKCGKQKKEQWRPVFLFQLNVCCTQVNPKHSHDQPSGEIGSEIRAGEDGVLSFIELIFIVLIFRVRIYKSDRIGKSNSNNQNNLSSPSIKRMYLHISVSHEISKSNETKDIQHKVKQLGHALIVQMRTQKLNLWGHSSCKGVPGGCGKQRFPVSQSDGQTISLLIALSNRHTT